MQDTGNMYMGDNSSPLRTYSPKRGGSNDVYDRKAPTVPNASKTQTY